MRNLRLLSWPVWLIGIGLVILGASALGALVSVGFRLEDILRLLAPGSMTPTIAVSIVAGLVGLVIFGIGLIAWVAYSSSSPARARHNYASIWTILSLLAVAIIINIVLTSVFLVAQAQSSPGDKMVLSPTAIVLSVITLDGPLIGLLYLRIVRPGVLSWREMGFTTDRFWQRVSIGLLVGVLAFIVAGLAGEALKAFGIESTQMETFAGIRGASVAQFIGVLLAGSVIAPICEETFFRGYVVTAISRTRGVQLAILVSSVLFALSHVNLTVFLPILLVGVIFAFVFSRTGSLIPSIVAHAVLNAVGFIAFYLQP
jgi:membrane protease YdiL (CAAX protease family)